MRASGETTEAEAADGISINAIGKESELLMKQPLDTANLQSPFIWRVFVYLFSMSFSSEIQIPG